MWGGDVSGLVPAAVLPRLTARVVRPARQHLTLTNASRGPRVDVHEKLDELSSLVEEARSMPMSASCIVNRAELLGLLEELRELLPEEFRHAQLLLDDREAVVEEGRREAQRVIAEAEVQRDLLTSETAVMAAAEVRAEEIRLAAVEEAQTMRAEVDDYVDSKLANFEVVLDKTHGGGAPGAGQAARPHRPRPLRGTPRRRLQPSARRRPATRLTGLRPADRPPVGRRRGRRVA